MAQVAGRPRLEDQVAEQKLQLKAYQCCHDEHEDLRAASIGDSEDVHIYNHDGQIIGGTYQHGSITRSNLYDLCPIFLEFPPSTADSQTWAIFDLCADGSTASCYLGIVRLWRRETGGPIAVRPTERTAVRCIRSGSDNSQRLSSTKKDFRNQIRQRDQACAVTGYSRADFVGLETAHIVPIVPDQQEVRQQGDAQSWTTDTDPNLDIDSSTPALTPCGEEDFLSPRNGLLNTAVHIPFDLYEWAINPQDGYKITVFYKQDTLVPIDGKFLSERPRSHGSEDSRVSGDGLRWHFEQAVLKNMKGTAGEEWPKWEDDLGEGCDHIAEIMKGPAPGERMELELENRLAGWTEHEQHERVS
ncbi:hypothetical protein BJX66DRAFT_339593 [Aspergillus keveii]|uniref:HNH nuclease domain-containing protein n=1 Tax=Aspergillus keveii TaxID=714993 RepID=A0ABR4G0X0_9EURO